MGFGTVRPLQLAQTAGLSGDIGMSHRFRVVLDSGETNLGTWSRAGGLGVGWTACRYRWGELDEDLILPGPTTYTSVKLSRAACRDSRRVQTWLARTVMDHTPVSGAIDMIDWTFRAIATWELKACYPVNWSITDFDAGTARPAVETLELAHTGFLATEQKSNL